MNEDLRSWWEDGGVWAGVARPDTPNFPLNRATPLNIGLMQSVEEKPL